MGGQHHRVERRRDLDKALGHGRLRARRLRLANGRVRRIHLVVGGIDGGLADESVLLERPVALRHLLRVAQLRFRLQHRGIAARRVGAHFPVVQTHQWLPAPDAVTGLHPQRHHIATDLRGHRGLTHRLQHRIQRHRRTGSRRRHQPGRHANRRTVGRMGGRQQAGKAEGKSTADRKFHGVLLDTLPSIYPTGYQSKTRRRLAPSTPSAAQAVGKNRRGPP